MKVVALAVLTVLIALPAEAVQRQNNFSQSCNNDGRCTTFNASTASQTPSLRGHHIRTSERKPHHVVDANGNSMLVTVQTAYGFNITVHPAYASKFQKFFALLKERGYKVPANITKCWAPVRHACTWLQPLHRCGLRYSDGLESRARVRLPHGRHRQTSWPVQRLHVPRLRSFRSGPWHVQPSAQPLRRHGKIQIGTIDSKLSTMSIFKSGLWFAPPPSVRPSMGRY
ncbi:MAG: hypothetical protein WAL36_10740, partial [Pseudolabrys sp.]